MKLYFVATSNWHIDLLHASKVKNVLVSYFYFSKEVPSGFHIALDSGAFSADNSGKSIDIDKFIEFAKANSDKCDVVFNLDVIGQKQAAEDSAEASYKNLKYIESKGVKTLPVFHQGEDFKWLDKLVSEYDYVGLGGVAGDMMKKRTEVEKWFGYIFYRYPRHKFHGLGVTGMYLLKKFPFYSVDSTSWLKWANFGRTLQFDKQALTMKPLRVNDILEDKKLITDAKFMRMIDPVEGLKMDSRKARSVHNIQQFTLLEKEVTRLWVERGYVWN